MKEGRNEWSNDRMKERKNQECLQPLWALTKALKPKQKSDLRGVVNAGQAKTHREWKAAQNFLRRRSTQVNETQESVLQEWEVLFYAKWHEMKWQSRDRQRKIEDQLKAVRSATYHVRALRSCGGRPLHFLSPTTQRDVFDDTRLCPEKENISINEKTCKALFSIFAVAWFLHRYSLVHLLPTSSTKSARPFLTIFMWNRALATVSCTFCRPHLPKVLRAPQLFLVLCDQLYAYLIMMRLAYDFELSISCAFCRPHLPKVPRAPQCFTICMWNRALATVSCAFCRPHLPKVPRAPQCFTICMWNRALATVSCTFCRPHLPKVLRARQFFFDFYVKSSLKVPDSFLWILCEIVL